MTDAAISITGVTRRFGKNTAVDNVSLEIPKGSIFGLLGSNGAGKTTLIRMLVGHLHTDIGTIRVLGEDPWVHDSQTLQRIAYVSDSMQLPHRMRIDQLLKLNAGFFPKWDHQLAESLLKKFELPRDKKYSTFSLGQKRRAVLLQALCQGADLIILDEPASGLDPLGRRHFLDVLLEANVDREQTVVFSSHILSDVERVVDRVAIMSHARILTEGNLEDLKSSLRRIRIAGSLELSELSDHFSILDHRVRGDITELLVNEFDESAWNTFQQSHSKDASAEQLNLEDMFVELSSAE
jgi:ABC-2 type transport system ATP-binding protein